MSPTIVVRSRQPILVLGAAGGARIIMGPLLAILNTVDFGLDLAHALDAERFDAAARLAIEDARVAPAVLAELERRGHTLVREGEYGSRPRMQGAGVDLRTGLRQAASDPRSEPGAVVQGRRARR
jgi:gamma-glutamyltranspeptidase/glutathione hydrolase